MRLKVKQPCSQNTFILCYIMYRALLGCCNNAPRLRQNHKSAHVATSKPSGIFLLRIMPLRLKNKQTKKPCNDSLLQDTGVLMQFAPIRRLTQAIRMNQPFTTVTWSQTSYQLSYMWRARVSPTKADPRSEARRGRSALKQEVDEIKRTNQIAVRGD